MKTAETRTIRNVLCKTPRYTCRLCPLKGKTCDGVLRPPSSPSTALLFLLLCCTTPRRLYCKKSLDWYANVSQGSARNKCRPHRGWFCLSLLHCRSAMMLSSKLMSSPPGSYSSSLCRQGVEGSKKVSLARLSTFLIQQLHKGKRSVKIKLWTRFGPQPLLLGAREMWGDYYSVGSMTTDNAFTVRLTSSTPCCAYWRIIFSMCCKSATHRRLGNTGVQVAVNSSVAMICDKKSAMVNCWKAKVNQFLSSSLITPPLSRNPTLSSSPSSHSASRGRSRSSAQARLPPGRCL